MLQKRLTVLNAQTAFHTNTERQFLHDVMRPRLVEALAMVWPMAIAASTASGEGLWSAGDERHSGEGGSFDQQAAVDVSTADMDPFILRALPDRSRVAESEVRV